MQEKQRGFSLLEMAVTLAIVAFLLGGLIMTLGAQQDRNREQETRRLLIQAREALYGFAMQTGRLPCPADGTLASGAPQAGREQQNAAGACTVAAASGVLPWATLALPEVDSWGNRFRYVVDPAGAFSGLSPAPAPLCGNPVPQAAFGFCTPAATLEARRIDNVVLATGLPAVVLSHGKNGFGAFNSSGAQQPAGSAAESDNADGNSPFRQDLPTATFDDQVEWIVPAILMHRMVQAGRLP